MFLLDTNVLSELRNLRRTDRNVRGWAETIPAEHLFVSAITIFEIERGVLRVARKDEAQALFLHQWLRERILPQFQGRILPIDASVALRCAPLHVPDPKPDRDSMIAATALVHAFTVVTRNTADFEGTGVRLLNPWIVAAD